MSDYSIVGKVVKEVVRETRGAGSGGEYEAIVRIEFTDGGAIVEGVGVVPPKSAIDRLMDGDWVGAVLCDNKGDSYNENLWYLNGVGLRSATWFVNLFPNDKTDNVARVTLGNGDELDLDELRRRVAERVIKHLAPYANLADLAKLLPKPEKPDISKEWWVIAERGLPELKEGVLYTNYWVNAEGVESGRPVTCSGSTYIVRDGSLIDRHGDIVTRIKEHK